VFVMSRRSDDPAAVPERLSSLIRTLHHAGVYLAPVPGYLRSRLDHVSAVRPTVAMVVTMLLATA
jgi:hypothetical protein